MLLPDDDYPIHQNAQPLSVTMNGHPNAYDRFWFNGYDESFYFAGAMGLYPNRGVKDAAFSVVVGDQQYSVFSSDTLTARETTVGPITLEIVEPLRVNRLRVDAPEQGLACDLTYTRRFATSEEPRQTMMDGGRIFMDVTRATQLGTWSGWIETPEGRREVTNLQGTKDRSWGIRPVGEPLPGAPSTRAPQLCFFWAPLVLGDEAVHAMKFDDPAGQPLTVSASRMSSDHVAHVGATLSVERQAGTRWMREASLKVGDEILTLTPLLRFHMRGAGYGHPTYAHGRFHGGPVTAGEQLTLSALDPLEYPNLHVQHVVRATSATRSGLGVLEQLIVGPYAPMGLTGLLDG